VGGGRIGGKVKKTEKGEGQRHRRLLTQGRMTSVKLPFFPHLLLGLMFLTGEGS
jgi:hypothetical protein